MDFLLNGQKMLASLMRRNRARDLRKRKFTLPPHPSFRCFSVGVVHYVHRLLMRGHGIPPIHPSYFFMTGRIVMFRTRKTVTDLSAKPVLLRGTHKGFRGCYPELAKFGSVLPQVTIRQSPNVGQHCTQPPGRN